MYRFFKFVIALFPFISHIFGYFTSLKFNETIYLCLFSSNLTLVKEKFQSFQSSLIKFQDFTLNFGEKLKDIKNISNRIEIKFIFKDIDI